MPLNCMLELMDAAQLQSGSFQVTGAETVVLVALSYRLEELERTSAPRPRALAWKT